MMILDHHNGIAFSCIRYVLPCWPASLVRNYDFDEEKKHILAVSYPEYILKNKFQIVLALSRMEHHAPQL